MLLGLLLCGGDSLDDVVQQGHCRMHVDRFKLSLETVATGSLLHFHELIFVTSVVWLSRTICRVAVRVNCLASYKMRH